MKQGVISRELGVVEQGGQSGHLHVWTAPDILRSHGISIYDDVRNNQVLLRENGAKLLIIFQRASYIVEVSVLIEMGGRIFRLPLPIAGAQVSAEFEARLKKIAHGELEELARILRRLLGSEAARKPRRPFPGYPYGGSIVDVGNANRSADARREVSKD